MESGVIPDESITASSHWDADLVANNGRLNAIDGFGAWAAGNSAVGEFLQVDFGHMKRVTGTIVQGRNVGVDQWVTSYKLQYSREATTWATYTVNDGSEKVFPGNTDRSTPVMNLLATDIDARYVRFVVQTWHNHISMRAEILGCNIDAVQCAMPASPTNGDMSGSNYYGRVLTFTCDTGYNLDSTSSSSTVTCQADGTWSGTPPTCTAVECPALTSPTNGALSGPSSYTVNQVFTFTCDTGYDLVGGTSAVTCQDDGTWSGTAPTCEAQQCPELTTLTNGAVSGSNTYGEELTFTCDTGYALVGALTLTCQADGTWSGSPPTCEVLQCPIVPSPTNGVKESSCEGDLTFTCDAGYNLVGSSTLTCQDDGTWSGTPPTCGAVQCPMLAAPTNGAGSGSNSYGEDFTFTCFIGYNLFGASTLTCQDDGTWNLQPPTCEASQCPQLPTPVNGAMTGSFTYMGVAQFTCNAGYHLVGATSIVCQADSSWSGTAPECQAVQCPPLTPPVNGAMTGESSVYQSVVQFTCDSGYDLEGPRSVACRADRSWSDSAPICNRVRCPLLTTPAHGTKTGDNLYQDVVTFACESGYELVGAASTTCQATATWSHSIPTCTRYELVGAASVTCQAEGTWSDNVPTCTPVPCPSLSPLDNGVHTGSHSNSYGDVAYFQCDAGFHLLGSSVRACQADRTWSGCSPTCTDVDECSSANGNCEQTCTNTIGSFHCSCETGYSLNDNGFTCDGRHL
ncbi:P-selectin-like [Branchiostoma floridae x Branchiostoma belcheri]